VLCAKEVRMLYIDGAALRQWKLTTKGGGADGRYNNT
jgi:hypothetical protein